MSCYHGSKISRLDNVSWQRRSFGLSNDGRKVWATVLFLSVIMHKNVNVNFFIFFLTCLQNHSYLGSRNFTTMAT